MGAAQHKAEVAQIQEQIEEIRTRLVTMGDQIRRLSIQYQRLDSRLEILQQVNEFQKSSLPTQQTQQEQKSSIFQEGPEECEQQ